VLHTTKRSTDTANSGGADWSRTRSFAVRCCPVGRVLTLLLVLKKQKMCDQKTGDYKESGHAKVDVVANSPVKAAPPARSTYVRRQTQHPR
jgi:hypothetical protein